LKPLVEVLEMGAKKYSRDNWKLGLPIKDVVDSLLRHAIALSDGELYDSESKLLHTGHIMANCMFINYYLRNSEATEETPKYVVFTEDYAERDLTGTVRCNFEKNEKYLIQEDEGGKYITSPCRDKTYLNQLIFAIYEIC
jgi:hypothetical protein